MLVQFDGSCHADRQVGGAGAALFEIQPQGIALVNWKSVALPECVDNIYAEATSAEVATDFICDAVKQRSFAVRKVYLQDILPLVKHMAFAGRMRRLDLQPIIRRIRAKQSRYFDFGIWMYRPREANVVADYLAGQASKFALTMQGSNCSPIAVQVDAPYDLAISTGAIVLEEKSQGPTILILRECPCCDVEQVETYMVFITVSFHQTFTSRAVHRSPSRLPYRPDVPN